MSPPADRSGVPVGSIITEARALRTDELPRAIIRRHDEMNALASALDPAVDGRVECRRQSVHFVVAADDRSR